MKTNSTVWAVQNLVEMNKAQLVAIWNGQPREKYTDCIPPKSKAGYVRSIVFFQNSGN